MGLNYKDKYTSIKIVDDPTNGLVKLGLSERFEADRKTKISNNFISQVEVLDSNVLAVVIEHLNSRLPTPTKNERILGLASSGVPLATAFALRRKSNFIFSTSGKFSGFKTAFRFSESHRLNKKHYFYGLHKNDSVIIVEDEVTSGNGLITFIKALQKYQVNIIAACTAIETLTFGAREKIKKNTGLDLISLIRINVE